jgi:hypothetical protein
MPSSATITAFYTFLPGKKAFTSKMNSNFAIFRGHIIPVDPNTATAASNNTYDLGSDESRWSTVYLGKLDLSLTSTTELIFEATTAGGYRFNANSVTGFYIDTSGYHGTNITPSPGATITAGIMGLAIVPIATIGITTPTVATAIGDIPGSTCTLTTVGRPVHIFLSGDTISSGISFYNDTTSSRNINVRYSIMRDTTTVATIDFRHSYFPNQWSLPITFIQAVDFPPAGTYNYYLKILNIDVLDVLGGTQTGAGAGVTWVGTTGKLVAGEI